MSAMKNYLAELVEECAGDNAFAAEAIEHALFTGFVAANSLKKDDDVFEIMSNYDAIIENYRAARNLKAAVKDVTDTVAANGNRSVAEFISAAFICNIALTKNWESASSLKLALETARGFLETGLRKYVPVPGYSTPCEQNHWFEASVAVNYATLVARVRTALGLNRTALEVA